MTVWMIGIDTSCSTYNELKRRNAVAQGWPDLGDLSDYIGSKNILNEIKVLCQQKHQKYNDDKICINAPRTFENLLNKMSIGDLVLGFQGTNKLCGICQLSSDTKYKFDDKGQSSGIIGGYDYAHILHPVTWIDWDDFTPFMVQGQTPSPGNRGVAGIKRSNKSQYVIPAAWQRFLKSNPNYHNKLKGMIMSQKYLNRMIHTGIHQMIFFGPPGTSKTHDAINLANEITKDHPAKERVSIIQFHPAYTYEDFVRGLRIISEPDKDSPIYKTINGAITQLAVKAFKDWESNGFPNPNDGTSFNACPKWVLIIDEINRAHLAAVLGELIYALEYRPHKKDEIIKHKVRIPYSIIDKATDGFEGIEKDEIVIPPNLFIIGTMNTADRSIGHLDYAVRRRFIFEPKLPDMNTIKNQLGIDQALRTKCENSFDELINFFEAKLAKNFYIDDLMPGHTYFLADSPEKLASKLAYQLYPLLREYVKDGVLVGDPNDMLWESTPFDSDVNLDRVYDYVLK